MRKRKSWLVIPIIGILASAAFMYISLILKQGMLPSQGRGVTYDFVMMAGKWMNTVLGINLFSVSMIAAGLCTLVLSPLCLGPHYGGRRSRMAGSVTAAGTGILSVMLIINGVLYNQFYLVMRLQGLMKLCNLLIALGVMAAGIGAIAFCCLEWKAARNISSLRSVLLIISAILFVLSVMAFMVFAGITMRRMFGIVSVSGYLFWFGFPFLCLSAAQLSGYFVRAE